LGRNNQGTPLTRIVQITVLILAGEMIFSLPFHTARFFRPTFLEVFALSNTKFCDIFAVYGITAMLAYFPGGTIADRLPPRFLLSSSLVLTACGGFYMATIPNGAGMTLLYGYWGVTTIFLFWAAMIKSAREWGGELSQGKAFGILDGGRGFVAACFAFIGVAVLSVYLPADVTLATDEERRAGFRSVILLYSFATGAIGMLTWFLLPASSERTPVLKPDGSLRSAIGALQRPIVWAQAGVILCAYCGYKGLDNYSLYAVQVLGMNEIEGARLSAYASYVRPIAAVAAGLLADRYVGSRIISLTFGVLVLSFGILALASPSSDWLVLTFTNIFISAFLVFALRGIYFSLLEETRIPQNITGTTVGIVSFLGFTPEFFFGPVTGRILDAAPGVEGHQNYFLFLTLVALLGLAVVLFLVRTNRRSIS
jgi:nitrate/nitrite transporter NarK